MGRMAGRCPRAAIRLARTTARSADKYQDISSDLVFPACQCNGGGGRCSPVFGCIRFQWLLGVTTSITSDLQLVLFDRMDHYLIYYCVGLGSRASSSHVAWICGAQ